MDFYLIYIIIEELNEYLALVETPTALKRFINESKLIFFLYESISPWFGFIFALSVSLD